MLRQLQLMQHSPAEVYLGATDSVCVLQPNIAAVYNLNTNTYVYLPMTDSPFCGAHLQLIDDRILVVGGDNIGLTPTFTDGR